jgi:hypothetical protein
MDDYVSGGYYVLKSIPRPSDLSNTLPEKLLTLSDCFTNVVTDIIQLQWDNYDNVRAFIADEAREFGIPNSRIPELVSWAKAQHNTNYTVYSDLGPALDLRDRFINDPSTHVIGIGLHTSLLDSFSAQLSKDCNRGLGLAELVNERRPPAPDGNEIGFEPVGFEATKFHSWLCNITPEEIYENSGIRPNRLGLIETFDQARTVNDYLLRTGAEPAIWEPWLLIDYPRKNVQE